MTAPRRRGFCPGLSMPMQTGDGLLVRLSPVGTMPLAAFEKLCAAAARHGNGVVEVSARGSIQIRGLNPSSASRFANEMAALGIAAADGIPILINPLAGIAAGEILNAAEVERDIRREIVRQVLAERVNPKVSVVIDGGGPLSLDTLAADVRLRAALANDNPAYRVSLGGDAVNAACVGFIASASGAQSAVRLLEILAQRGRGARARAIIDAEGTAVFRSAISDLLIDELPCSEAPRRCGALANHFLLDGTMACGVGLAFGHADASSLQRLILTARAVGAKGFVTAPDRTLVAVGISRDSVNEFSAAAEQLGFIVRGDDARRHVVACPGAPFCASGQIEARTIAPSVAGEVARRGGEALAIHISGCAKGCAHPAPAPLTIVGTPQGCALVANGTARDAAFATVSLNRLPAEIARVMGEAAHV